MSLADAGLAALLGAAALASVLALVLPARRRSLGAGLAVAAAGVAGAASGVSALLGDAGSGLRLPIALPGAGGIDPLSLTPDALGGFFMLLSGAVIALSALFGIGYAHGPAASRTGWVAFAAFAAGVLLVPAAADAVSFLLAWELMAGGSTVLLLADHAARPAVRRAALWYAVMTHLSFLLLVAGFGVLALAGGGTGWGRLTASTPPAPLAGLAFVLLALGFLGKAGLVPLHVWLPLAHPEAPSHVSAAMSAAMVKMGVYGVLLVTLRLLPGGPRWWALLLLVLGAASALYGILQASVQADLKRLLAYSTTENVGLIVTAAAVGLLLRASGQTAGADLALLAALLLALSHAAFKTLLFLGAGSVLHATGLRDLDLLGGLAARMPWTASAFGVGAMGAAALPVTSGFVAEWALLQALIHSHAQNDPLLAVAMPIMMAVVALTIGLGLLTFVKAFGIGFLARPRTPEAAAAHEAGPAMRTALILAAALTVGLGLAPGPIAALVAPAVSADGVVAGRDGRLEVPAFGLLLDPGALAVLAAALAVAVVGLNAALARRHPRREVALAWGCGGERTSPRMEYNATSYSEPLVRVFRSSLQPTRLVDVVHHDEAPLLVTEVSFRQETVDVVEDRVYLPAARGALRLGDLARRVQNGSIHRYVGFSFAALLLVLLAVAR